MALLVLRKRESLGGHYCSNQGGLVLLKRQVGEDGRKSKADFSFKVGPKSWEVALRLFTPQKGPDTQAQYHHPETSCRAHSAAAAPSVKQESLTAVITTELTNTPSQGEEELRNQPRCWFKQVQTGGVLLPHFRDLVLGHILVLFFINRKNAFSMKTACSPQTRLNKSYFESLTEKYPLQQHAFRILGEDFSMSGFVFCFVLLLMSGFLMAQSLRHFKRSNQDRPLPRVFIYYAPPAFLVWAGKRKKSNPTHLKWVYASQLHGRGAQFSTPQLASTANTFTYSNKANDSVSRTGSPCCRPPTSRPNSHSQPSSGHHRIQPSPPEGAAGKGNSWKQTLDLTPGSLQGCTTLTGGPSWQQDRGVREQTVATRSGKIFPGSVSFIHQARRLFTFDRISHLQNMKPQQLQEI